MKLILASGSPYRKALLERLQLPFQCHCPDVDERALENEPPMELSMRLADAKAQAVAGLYPQAIIVGSDQVASLDGELLGKPGNFDAAFAQLRKSSGRCVAFHTGLTLLRPGASRFSCSVPIKVYFRDLTDTEIKRYLELEQPFDCAGSFKCEGLGVSLFARLEGEDPTALEGLPLISLCRMLREAGLDPLA
jgi:septum formation protein